MAKEVESCKLIWSTYQFPSCNYTQHSENSKFLKICYPKLQNMNTSITSCICTPGACCMWRRFSNTCILIVLIYDLLFKFSCTIEKQKGKLDLKQSTDTAKSHNNQLRITYYVSTRNLQQIIRSKIFYVLIIWDLCKRNKRK